MRVKERVNAMKSNTTLLIARDRSLYFFPYCSTIDVWSGSELPVAAFKAQSLTQEEQSLWREKLKPYKLIVFLDYGFEAEMGLFAKKYATAKVVLFFWNRLVTDKLEMLDQARSQAAVDAIFSFDALEAEKYGLLHNSTFYSMDLPKKVLPIQQDLFFGAANHGRRERALKIKKTMEEQGLSVFFHMTESRGIEDNRYLPYIDYLEKVFESRGILEVMREGQTGITLRCQESIFLEKKLVTTNRKVKDYQFYRPENIFILGEDPLETLNEFMDIPLQPLAQGFKDFYDSEQWAQRFFTQDKADFQKYEYKYFE